MSIDPKFIESFKRESGESAYKTRIETAEKRARAQGRNFSKDIITTLQTGGIPQSEIDRLTKSVNNSTAFNAALSRLLTTSAKALSLLRSIL